jgi:competence protein ComEC
VEIKLVIDPPSPVGGWGLESDVLKIAHHGSKSSTNQLFLEKVNPDIAVISVGAKNSYGHPHQEVLERLSVKQVFRTDLDGDIEILTDGKNIETRREK